MMKIERLVLLSALVMSGSWAAQAQPQEDVLSALVDSVRIAHDIPGAACAIICRDTILYGVAGSTRLVDGAPITSSSVFHIGSCTKSFTGMLAIRLHEKGILRLEEKLLDVVPSLSDIAKRAYRDITLAELLSHRAGIRPFTDSEESEFKGLEEWPAEDRNARKKFAEHALQLKPVKDKKESFIYSNGGVVLAALMMEERTGRTWEQLVKEYIEANGMAYHIGFPNEEDPSQPWGHERSAENVINEVPLVNDFSLWPWVAPAGDLALSIEDFARYLQINMNGIINGDEGLSKEGYTTLHFSNEKYALGWGHGLISDRFRFSTHSGSAGTYLSSMLVVPELDFAVVILCNIGDDPESEQAVRSLRNLLLKRFSDLRKQQ